MTDPVLACPCDEFEHPRPLRIGAGLDSIPRQIAGFPEFRRALLAAVAAQPGLAGWRARADDDLGLMLLELWAYVCDVLAFYDEVHAHELYLRTARLRPSLRRLVSLLGYVPRPAVAAFVELALLGDGRRPVVVPAGTAFRSSAFDGQPPQVFELDALATIHPLNNSWRLESGRATLLGVANPSTLLLRLTGAAPSAGQPLLLGTGSGVGQARLVASVAAASEPDGRASRIGLATAASLPATTPLASLTVSAPTRRAGLWTRSSAPALERLPAPLLVAQIDMAALPLATLAAGPQVVAATQATTASLPSASIAATAGQVTAAASAQVASASFTSAVGQVITTAQQAAVGVSVAAAFTGPTLLTLDAVYDIKAGDTVIVCRGTDCRVFVVDRVGEVTRQAGASSTVTVNGSTFTVPPPSLPATQLTLDAYINSSARRPAGGATWDNGDREQLVVHWAPREVGVPLGPLQNDVAAPGPLALGPQEPPVGAGSPRRFLLEDRDGASVAIGGALSYGSGLLTPDQGEDWQPPLVRPVTVYGNVVRASRGETVAGEYLGTGDASRAGQSFTLKKKRLTYLTVPSGGDERGLVSTLTIMVNNIRWSETPSFFGVAPDARVYTVRQNDAEESIVTFGDGVRGARLPSGASVVASYRYGAGAASPPAGGISQLAKPVPGLRGVRNPLAAAGGADAEEPEGMRSYAPRSALLLGRAVSLADMEAAAAGVAGVRAVAAEWRWHQGRQRPVAQIWYIGASSLAAVVGETLRRISDPAAPIVVEQAQGLALRLTFDLELDARYVADAVLAELREALTGAATGLLTPERIGIGKPLYRSQLFAAAQAIPGVVAVRALFWNGLPLRQFARSPGAGRFFDLEAGALTLNGRSGNA